jgi:hypothetical protein
VLSRYVPLQGLEDSTAPRSATVGQAVGIYGVYTIGGGWCVFDLLPVKNYIRLHFIKYEKTCEHFPQNNNEFPISINKNGSHLYS